MRANLNKENLIEVDVKNATVETITGSMTFYATDENTCNIFCKLTTPEPNEEFLDLELMNHVAIDNAEDFAITMRMIDPDGNPLELAFTLLDPEDAIFYVDLTDEYLYYAGTYKCELFVDCIAKEKRERITTSPFSYEVKKSIWSELDNNLNGDPAQSVIDTLATMIYVDDSIAAIPETDLLHNFASISYVDDSISRYDNEITKQDFASKEYVLSAFDNIKYEIEKAGYTTESYVNKEIEKFNTSINSLLINDYAPTTYVNDRLLELRTDFANSFAPMSYVNSEVTRVDDKVKAINWELADYAKFSYVDPKFSSINSRINELVSKPYATKEELDELENDVLEFRSATLEYFDDHWQNIEWIMEDWAKIEYVDQKISEAQLGGGEGGSIDLSGYATKDYVDTEVGSVWSELGEFYATKDYVHTYIDENGGGSSDGVTESKMQSYVSERISALKNEDLPEMGYITQTKADTLYASQNYVNNYVSNVVGDIETLLGEI